MIELLSQSRCIGCNKCVEICPTNVYEGSPGEIPVIARQSECQTCFLCEAYCPVDALYVAAETNRNVEVNEEELIAKGLLGSYRRNLGWSKGDSPSRNMNELLELQQIMGSR